MRLRHAVLATGAAAAVSLALPATSPAAVCAKAAGLSFHRVAGKTTGKLTWRTPNGRFRVYRNGVVVGQTVGRSIRVAVKPGRKYVFAVRPVRSSGKVSRCETRLEQRMDFFAPFRPKRFHVRKVTKTGALLEWRRARKGDGRLTGYRVFRNGKVYRQVLGRRLSIRVRFPSGQLYRFWVAAADSRGHLSRRSRVVKLGRGHIKPGKPRAFRAARVGDTVVGLTWSKAETHSSRIVGYRVYKQGSAVAQVKGLSGDIGNLAPVTPYQFTVAAVDSQGYVGPAAGPLNVQTAVPPPTRGRLHAFLLASVDESFRDLQRHYQQIGTLYPTYFDCYGPGGSLQGADDPLVTRWARLRQIAVLPRFNCQNSNTLHTILTDPAARSRTLARLMELVQTYGYEGLNIDFEAGYATDRPALTTFITMLAQQLHAIGKRVTVDVSAKWSATTTGRSGFYDYPALGLVADNVFVMAWGWNWTTSSPGPPDEIVNVTRVADYVATMPNKSRFVLGMPLYVQDWPNGGGASSPSVPYQYEDLLPILARFGGTPVLDPGYDTWHYTYTDAAGYHDVWYGDATTIGHRLRLASARGLGVGFWRLGREDQRIWDDPIIAPGSVWP